jgi:hypothetical protein
LSEPLHRLDLPELCQMMRDLLFAVRPSGIWPTRGSPSEQVAVSA